MTIIAYGRVSTKAQEKEGYSLDAQQREFKEYAQAKGFKIDKYFVESGSAKKSKTRPKFNEMIGDIYKSKSPVKLLAHKLDRIARNYKDYGSIEELIFDKGLELHLVHDRIVLTKNSPYADFLACGFNLVTATGYSRNLSTEITKGMREKARQGWTPCQIPHGYKHDRNARTIVTIEDEARLVKRAFELCGSGNYSIRMICNQLYNEGFVFKPERPKVTPGTLHKILKNKFYTGQFQMNGETFPGLHKPVITLDEYQRVQKAFEQANRPKAVKHHEFAFTGLLTCGRCGCAISAQIQKGKYVYYHCSNFHKTCKDQPYTKEIQLVEMFEGAFKSIVVPEANIPLIIKDLKDGHQEQMEYHQKQTETISRQIGQSKARLNTLLTLRMDGEVSPDTYRTKQSEIQEEVARLENALQSHNNANFDYIERAENILELANNAHRLFLSQNPDGKRRLINLVLSNYTLDAGKLHYEYNEPFDSFHKMSSCQNWWSIGDSNS